MKIKIEVDDITLFAAAINNAVATYGNILFAIYFCCDIPTKLEKLKEIISVEEYGKGVTAQVIGVVNMDGYIARVEEENRLKELAKKKVAIEKELEAEINKRKSVEYYEEMAKKYSDNPKLAELVAELKGLGA